MENHTLIIEQDLITAKALQQSLERWFEGYFQVTKSLDSAKELIAIDKPSLIVLDISHHNAFDEIIAGRAFSKHMRIPLICLSSGMYSLALSSALNGNTSRIIAKPYLESDLHEAFLALCA